MLDEGARVEYDESYDERKGKPRAERVSGGRQGDDRGPPMGGGGEGACRDFSMGRCTRGDGCRFSHGGQGGGGGCRAAHNNPLPPIAPPPERRFHEIFPLFPVESCDHQVNLSQRRTPASSLPHMTFSDNADDDNNECATPTRYSCVFDHLDLPFLYFVFDFTFVKTSD